MISNESTRFIAGLSPASANIPPVSNLKTSSADVIQYLYSQSCAKAPSHDDRNLKTYRFSEREISLRYDAIKGVYAQVTESDDRVVEIPSEWVSGIPGGLAKNPVTLERFLQKTSITANKLNDNGYHIRINQLILGGGIIFDEIFGIADVRIDGIPFPESPKGCRLVGPSRLNKGEFLTSPNGAFLLVLHQWGELAMYHYMDGKMWTSAGTEDKPLPEPWAIEPKRSTCLRMQTDGNLVLYHYHDNGRKEPIWSIHKALNEHLSKAQLWMQDDGNIVVYKFDGPRECIWASNTVHRWGTEQF